MRRSLWPDLGRRLLRKAVGAPDRRSRHAARDCGRTPLVGERMYRFAERVDRSARSAATRRAGEPDARRARPPLRARPPVSRAAPHRGPSRRRSRADRRRLPPRGSRSASVIDRPPARGGLRVPRGHRQPRGVLRPLPGRLAPDARGLLRPRRRRALPGQDAAATASPGPTSTFTEVERAAADRRARPAGKFNRIRTRGIYELEPSLRRHDARDLHVRDQARSCSPTGSRGAGRARWLKRKNKQGAAPPARDPRGGPGPRARGRPSPAAPRKPASAFRFRSDLNR